MELNNDLKRLQQTIAASTSPYHCILESEAQLKEAGFTELKLDAAWSVAQGGSYYVNVFDSTLVAFRVGSALSAQPSLRIASSHTDWPCLKLKPSPEVTTNRYGKLNVEVYGGPILNTWFDRPLSIAGKVCVTGKTPFEPETRFVDFKRPLLTVPNLAIHMNREVNDGVKLNAQIDMLPLLTLVQEKLENKDYFVELLAKEAGVDKADILDYEMYIYNLDQGCLVGLDNEFYSSPRLDNITSVQACLTGLVENHPTTDIDVIALYDNEEIGSHTKQGAAAATTERMMKKLLRALDFSDAAIDDILFGGFLLSIDVAHALHPNHVEKCDIKNQIILGDGVAIKMAASQAYATDSRSTSVIEGICRANNIPYKKFSNRSDVKGGSTLGSISSALLGMKAVDIGVTLLAMHSSREIMGAADQTALNQLVVKFFESK